METKAVLEQEKVIKTMEKLKREKVLVSLNPKKFLMEYTKVEIKKLEEMPDEGMSEADLKMKQDMIGLHSKNLAEYEVAKLEGYLVPLKYRDLQAIKDGVLEALKYSQEFNWDEAIKVKAMVREEHTLTVYFSLRKKEDTAKRYYDSLEKIALETETTIEELYRLYLENFVITDEERKNS